MASVKTVFLVLIKLTSFGTQMINSLLNLKIWLSHRAMFLNTVKVKVQ